MKRLFFTLISMLLITSNVRPSKGTSVIMDCTAPGFWNDRAVVVGKYLFDQTNGYRVEITTVILTGRPIATDKKLINPTGAGIPTASEVDLFHGPFHAEGWAVFCLVYSKDSGWNIEENGIPCLPGGGISSVKSPDDPQVEVIEKSVRAAYLKSISTAAPTTRPG